MCQAISPNWYVIGLTLADLFLFGVFYALFVRLLWKRQVEGQTAYLVVFGVGLALAVSIPTFGLMQIAIQFLYFAACGLPMVIEYVQRTHSEHRRDVESAQNLAKEAVNDADQATDR